MTGHTAGQPATRTLWDFPGGLHLPPNKLDAPIADIPLPRQLIVPLRQHAGQPAQPIVGVGDHVLAGQCIAEAGDGISAAVHAATSGTVRAIEERLVPHPSGLPAACIVIDSDGLDRSLPAVDAPDDPFTLDPFDLDPASVRERVRAAGVVGLGGAAFPAFIKLDTSARRIHTLIINGAECEPYIACDQALMTAEAETILRGAQVIRHAVGATTCIVGIEDSKTGAIAALRAAAQALADDAIEIVVVRTRYPQGGERQLIQTLTGQEVPSGGLPPDIGMLCHNPGTAHAVWRAVTLGAPLIDRVVTVTGPAVAKPGNFRVRLGTPVADLLAAAGGLTDPHARLIMGGPMMGFALPGDAVPVVKATNCILAMRAVDLQPRDTAMPCIRCGACAEVCPASLLPQQLYWHAKAREFDKTQHYHLFDCIECGCCAQVCPSHIPLVDYYRFAKTEIWHARREAEKADIARQRHEARDQRLAREAAEKKAAREARKAALRAKQARTDTAATAGAVAGAADGNAASNPAADDNAAHDPVAAAIARAKARRAATRSTPDSGVGADTTHKTTS